MNSWPTVEQFLTMSSEEFGRTDPLVMNLVVAKGIPSLANLDIGHYAALADEWAADIRQRLPRMEPHFHRSPQDWKNDIRFFRLGIVCWYVDEVLKATYPDELANAEDRVYVDRRRGVRRRVSVLDVDGVGFCLCAGGRGRGNLSDKAPRRERDAGVYSARFSDVSSYGRELLSTSRVDLSPRSFRHNKRQPN
jgi:hypothetical protein